MATVTKREWTAPTGEQKTAWVCRYTDQEGKRRLKTFERKKDADQFRTETADQIERGVHIADREALTVKDVCRLFLRHNEMRRRDGRITGGTEYSWGLFIEKKVVPFFGTLKFKDLTVSKVEAFYRHLVTIEKNSPRTARDRIRILSTIEAFALKRRLTKQEIVRDVLRDMGKLPIQRVSTFDHAQIVLVLRAAENPPPLMGDRMALALKLFVHLAAFCGLRKGEIAALTADAIDFMADEIHIRHSLSMTDGVKGPKSAAGIRSVPLPPHVAAMLREWMAKHAFKNPEGLLFSTKGQKPMHFSALHRYWRALLGRAGLWEEGAEIYHFHALRHFFASLMIEGGMPVTDLAKIIGHSTPAMTLSVYAHAIKTRGRQNHEAINKAAERVLLVPPTIEGDLSPTL